MDIPWINVLENIHLLLSPECRLEGNVLSLGTSGEELILLCGSVTSMEIGKSWYVFRKEVLHSGFVFTRQYTWIKLRIIP